MIIEICSYFEYNRSKKRELIKTVFDGMNHAKNCVYAGILTLDKYVCVLPIIIRLHNIRWIIEYLECAEHNFDEFGYLRWLAQYRISFFRSIAIIC